MNTKIHKLVDYSIQTHVNAVVPHTIDTSLNQLLDSALKRQLDGPVQRYMEYDPDLFEVLKRGAYIEKPGKYTCIKDVLRKSPHGEPGHDHYKGEKTEKQKTIRESSATNQSTPAKPSQQNPLPSTTKQPKDAKLCNDLDDTDLENKLGNITSFDAIVIACPDLEEREILEEGPTIAFLT
ncbi:hypothetical protein Tco_1518795 [Tanacetum coccineum]